MRRLLLLLLPLALLCACTTAPAEQADAPFSFYYRCAEIAYGSEDGVIRAEAAPLEPDAGLRTVVLQYLKGPASPELRTPLPADWALESIGLTEGTALRSVSVENGVCTVDLSSQFLTGMPRSWNTERLAVYAIVNSLTELPQIQTVDLWIAGAPVERLYVLELENGLARDERMIYVPALDGTLDVTLSLTCDTMPLLAQVPMQLTLAEGVSSVQCVLEALLALEGENGLENSIPQGTKILSLKLAGGVCTLDLTAEFLEGCRTAEQERMAVREIVASLSALPEVETVDLLVEGLEPNYRDDSLQAVHTARNYWFVS